MNARQVRDSEAIWRLSQCTSLDGGAGMVMPRDILGVV